MLLFNLLIAALMKITADALDVTVTTEPVGPTYKAGTLYTVTCNASNAFQPYTLEWSLGCTYTNTFSSYVTTEAHTIGFYATTSKTCENIYRCRVTDSFSTIAIGQVIIETITDIAIQILLGPNSFAVTRNISILTTNDTGRFIDIICNTGLKQPNLGKWIHPNGNEITAIDEKFTIERGGGIVSLPYSTLMLKDGYSLDTQDTGLYTCKMPDVNMVERESHIWILPEQDFKVAGAEYFWSYSETVSVKLHCGFSNTPGEIVWKYGGNTITNDAVYKISQRLLKTEPVLYEGVLEINDKLNGLIPYCTIYSTIIGSRVDLISKSKVITVRHYFFLKFVGQTQYITCSFGEGTVTSIQIHSNGQTLQTTNGTTTSYTIGTITDTSHNQEFSCIGTVPDDCNVYLNLTIVALIPNHALAMHVTIPNMVEAGESITIGLSAIKTHGFSYDQSISCTDDNGVTISDLEGFTYPEAPMISGLTLHFEVPVGIVNLSHAGLYFCTSFLETPPQLDNISDSANFTIKVKVPSPVVILNGSMIDKVDVFEVGGVAIFNCSITIDSSFIDLPILAVVKWRINGQLIESENRFLISETTSAENITNSSMKYYSRLQIAPLLKEDTSILSCGVYITIDGTSSYIVDSGMVNSSLSLFVEGAQNLSTTFIQLQLVELETQCSEWILQPMRRQDLADAILGVLIEKCSCQYSLHHIIEQHFECSEDSSTEVTFRAKLYSSNEIEAATLVQYLQEWVNSKSNTIHIINQTDIVIKLNTDCGVGIDSYNDTLCSVVLPNTTPIEFPITQLSMISPTFVDSSRDTASTQTISNNGVITNAPVENSDDKLFHNVAMLSSACTGGILLLVGVPCLVVFVIWIIRKRKTKKRKRNAINAANHSTIGEMRHMHSDNTCYSLNVYSVYDTCQGDYMTRQLPDVPLNEDLKKEMSKSTEYMDMAGAIEAISEYDKNTYESIRDYSRN